MNERPTDKLAEFLRDCLIGLIFLAMVGWLIYVGVTAIATGHLDLGRGIRTSHPWFFKPVNGAPAVMAGVSFLCLAGAFLSVACTQERIARRLPSWCSRVYWWLFAAWGALYFTSRWISGA